MPPETVAGESPRQPSFFEAQKFDGEYWRYLGGLLVSEYATQILKNIFESGLSPDAQQEFWRLIFTYFDKDIIIANLTDNDIEIKTLELKRALLCAKVAMIQNDTLIPDYNGIARSIETEFHAVITRAVGKERERKLQHGATGAPAPEAKAEEARGWDLSNLLPWGRR